MGRFESIVGNSDKFEKIQNSTKEEVRDWTWWSKNDPQTLERMKKDLPETFWRLYNDEFKK